MFYHSVLDKNQRQEGESLRGFLIRTGKITPFDPLPQNAESSTTSSSEVNRSGIYSRRFHYYTDLDNPVEKDKFC